MENKRKHIGNRLRFHVLERDRFTCRYCGRQSPDVILEIDHKIPVVKGGDNSIDNLVTSCYQCNSGKSDYVFTNHPQYIKDLNIHRLTQIKKKIPSIVERDFILREIQDFIEDKYKIKSSEHLLSLITTIWILYEYQKNPFFIIRHNIIDFIKNEVDDYEYLFNKLSFWIRKIEFRIDKKQSLL